MAGQIKWTEKKIASMQAEGYGSGTGADYKPWLDVIATNSIGRTSRLWSPKTGRTHELLSDVEKKLFLALEWQRDITDIREQYPFDRDLTQEVARSLGIRHPAYPGTNVPTVMTVDFMVTRIRDGQTLHEAYNAKRTEEAEDARSLEKLEIQRAVSALLEQPHHLVFHSDIPEQRIKNLEWIRESVVRPSEGEPSPGFWSEMTARLASSLSLADQTLSLAEFASDFDAMHGVQAGTGLRAARILMFQRVVSADLASPSLVDEPLHAFQITGAQGKLRAVGGR